MNISQNHCPQPRAGNYLETNTSFSDQVHIKKRKMDFKNLFFWWIEVYFSKKKAMQMTNGDAMILKQGNVCKVTVELKKRDG